MSTSRSLPSTAECLFLSGPTGAGKSAVGIELARRLDGEIISLDSMALYRGMDIGTAKPSAAERAAAPHHLIDIIEPCATYSLAQYVAAAEACAADITARGRQPMFVGGTPLYLKALLRGIFAGPPADWEFRERLSAAAVARSPEWLHAEVRRVDPVAAERLHPQDTKRLIRVLEVFEKTGRPISELQRQFDQPRPAADRRVFVLELPRPLLYERINARVERMFASGLIDEVRRLVGAGPADDVFSRTARQALAYRETLEYLAGEHSLGETIELVQNRTRAFARRQLTWFRSLSECRTIAIADDEPPAATAERVVACLSS